MQRGESGAVESVRFGPRIQEIANNLAVAFSGRQVKGRLAARMAPCR